jgi:hypothetical protein
VLNTISTKKTRVTTVQLRIVCPSIHFERREEKVSWYPEVFGVNTAYFDSVQKVAWQFRPDSGLWILALSCCSIA